MEQFKFTVVGSLFSQGFKSQLAFQFTAVMGFYTCETAFLTILPGGLDADWMPGQIRGHLIHQGWMGVQGDRRVLTANTWADFTLA